MCGYCPDYIQLGVLEPVLLDAKSILEGLGQKPAGRNALDLSVRCTPVPPPVTSRQPSTWIVCEFVWLHFRFPPLCSWGFAIHFPPSLPPQLHNCQVLLPRKSTSLDHLDVTIAHLAVSSEFTLEAHPDAGATPSLVSTPKSREPNLLFEHQVSCEGECRCAAPGQA